MSIFPSALALLLAAAFQSSSDASETPATPSEFRIAPDYPAVCHPASSETVEPQTVVVTFDVNRKGMTENVRVMQSTDSCFDETAVSAVRGWRYTPRQVNGADRLQESLETTFTFIFSETTQAEDFDARPLVRVPPRYPDRCQHRADDNEFVVLEYDVTIEGETENIQVFESTNPCFDIEAIKSVEKWRYRPKTVAGEPVVRKGVRTQVVFTLTSDSSDYRVRRAVSNHFTRVKRALVRESDPQKALLILEDIEAEYGDSFSRAELQIFHQLRGAARIETRDYAGALDDFRAVQRIGLTIENRDAVEEVIAQLEDYLAAQEAAETQNSDSSESDEIEN